MELIKRIINNCAPSPSKKSSTITILIFFFFLILIFHFFNVQCKDRVANAYNLDGVRILLTGWSG